MLELKLKDNLFLRTFELEHAQELSQLVDRNRDRLRQWMPWVDGTKSVQDTSNFIQMTMDQKAQNNGFQCGIWQQERLIGVVGFHKVDWANRNVSLGYWLDQDASGQGIMTCAVSKLVHYAFHDMSLNRVEISCAPANIKSNAIPRRLGFKMEGVLRHKGWLYDHFVDHNIYAILHDEFN